jgi:hypothetical protein
MKSTCPDCGAIREPGQHCSDRFSASQFLELERPAYYTVHHLCVPSYMLQHNAYSRAGWISVRELVRHFVFDGLTPAMARERLRDLPGGSLKNWSYTKGPGPPGVEDIAWSMTIADIRLDTADSYCTDVRAWARQIIDDTEGFTRRLSDND